MAGMEWKPNAFATDGVNQPASENLRKDRMSELKQQIERHEYKVDSARVAEEMVKRLRLAHWARRALVSNADETRGPRAAAS